MTAAWQGPAQTPVVIGTQPLAHIEAQKIVAVEKLGYVVRARLVESPAPGNLRRYDVELVAEPALPCGPESFEAPASMPNLTTQLQRGVMPPIPDSPDRTG